MEIYKNSNKVHDVKKALLLWPDIKETVWFPWDIVSRTQWLEIRGGQDLGWFFFLLGWSFHRSNNYKKQMDTETLSNFAGQVCKLKISIWLALSFVVNVGCIALCFCVSVCVVLLSLSLCTLVMVLLYYWCTQRVFLGRKGKESLVTHEECTYKHPIL